MRTRLLLAPLIALIAVPAFADPPKPHVVIQFQPLDDWVADAKAVAAELGL